MYLCARDHLSMKLSGNPFYSSHRLSAGRQGTFIHFGCFPWHLRRGSSVCHHIIFLLASLFFTRQQMVQSSQYLMAYSFALHFILQWRYSEKHSWFARKLLALKREDKYISLYLLLFLRGRGWLLFFKGFVFTTLKICVWQVGLHVGPLTTGAEAVSDSVAFLQIPFPNWASLSGFRRRGCT